MNLNICVIGLKCHDLLVREAVPRYLGGIERQLVSLAEGLVARGHRVSCVTYDHGVESQVSQHGVNIIPAYGPDDGLPVLRFFFPRLYGVRKAIVESGADVVLQMGASSETGAASIGCIDWRGPNRLFLFCAASDSDCLADTPLIGQTKEKFIYRFGLRRANGIVVQTQTQRDSLLREFGLESSIIQMPGGSVTDLAASVNVDPTSNRRVLWIGRLSPEKRLDYLLDVADALPDVGFDIVGDANIASSYAARVKDRMSQMDNVIYHGKAGDEDLVRHFKNASLLACTSEIEGFPTTFLEAWSFGIPTVTTFDPDHVVERHGLGEPVKTKVDMVKCIGSYVNNAAILKVASSRCREYFFANHSAQVAAERFESRIRSLISDGDTERGS